MSDKALSVMEMPEKGCISCVIGRNHSIPLEVCIYCPISGKNAIGKEAEIIPDWCPLKPVPEKKICEYFSIGRQIRTWREGWNACIDRVLEEKHGETDTNED